MILSHSASGGDYGSVTANLTVNVKNICERMDALNSDETFCDLSAKGITSLSSGDFDGLSALVTLDLRENSLSSLPEDIFAGLPALVNLDLKNNNLSSLPEDIFAGLSNLKRLWLRENDLTSLPEDIFAGLSKVHFLTLYNNDLSSLPEDIFAGLSDLQDLYLSYNDLSSLPEDIFARLSDLENLYLSYNDLSSLPEDIFAGLSDLELLSLTNNSLSSLPEDIFTGLSNLESLFLNENSLTCLPTSLPSSVNVDVNLPQCGNTNTTAALTPWLIATGTLEPLTLYVGGEDGSRDGSTAFSVDNDKAGDITWHFTSSHPAVASVSEEPTNNPIVMVTPVREGKATITVRVANGNRISGPASFLVTVVTSPAEETAIRAALSGQGRVILGSVTDMIGKRFDSGTGGTGSSGSVCLNSAAGPDGESATSDESGSYGESSDYLIASDIWQGESWNTDLAATGLRGVPHVGQRDDEDSMDKTFDDLLELFRGQPHSLHPADWGLECGKGAVAEVSRPWTLWAGTDLQWARGGTETSDFDGEWQLYYLGADRAFREQWLAGLSLSQVHGEVDYSFEDATAAGAGQLSSNLTAIYPYLHGQLSSNLELWAIGGIGFGDVENEREHVDGDADQGDLHMRLLSLGLRRSLSQAGSTIDLALTSDAGFLSLSTEGDGSLDGAEA
ncbi:MAG: autotransporter domain-containing protein, partial [Aphanocapsa feldmannii 277cV]